MCDCYKIGGPWIDYDPSCPLHGDEAREAAAEYERMQVARENESAEMRARIEELSQRILEIERAMQLPKARKGQA